MVDNALIINLSENEIQVVPLISDACINCQKSGCTKQGKPFSVVNPKNLEIKKGDIVKFEWCFIFRKHCFLPFLDFFFFDCSTVKYSLNFQSQEKIGVKNDFF